MYIDRMCTWATTHTHTHTHSLSLFMYLGDEGVEVFSVGLGWRHELERREVVGDV